MNDAVKHRGLPEWLRPYGNTWRSAGQIANVLRIITGVETHGWIYKNRDRIKFVQEVTSNGKMGRKFLVKHLWAVVRADGLEVEPAGLTVAPAKRIADLLAEVESLTARNAALFQSNVMNTTIRRRVETVRVKVTDPDLIRLLVLSTEPRPAPGVYFLIRNGQIVYVGQSKNVLSRMIGHVDKAFSSVRMVEVQDTAERLALEKELIGALNPPLNINGVDMREDATVSRRTFIKEPLACQ